MPTDQPAHAKYSTRANRHPRLPEKLSRLVIPEECQRNQGDGDDPQHDVFTAVLFFGHKGSTAYLKSHFKCSQYFPVTVMALVRPPLPSCSPSTSPLRASALTAP